MLNGFIYATLSETNVVNFLTKGLDCAHPKRTKWDFIKTDKETYDYLVNYFDEPIDPDVTSVEEVIYRMKHHIMSVNDIPMCKQCGKERCKFISFKSGYSDCCSVECANKYLTFNRHQDKKDEPECGQEITVDNIIDFFKIGKRMSPQRTKWEWVKTFDNGRLFEFIENFFDEEPILYDKESVTSVLYRITHNIKKYPICANPSCNNRACFRSMRLGFSKCCCHKCIKGAKDAMTPEEIKEMQEYNKKLREKRLEIKTVEINSVDDLKKFILRDNGDIIDSRVSWRVIKNNKSFYNFVVNYFSEETIDDSKVTGSELIYRIIHNIKKRPICPICKTNYLKFNSWHEGYNKFCSKECQYSEDGIKSSTQLREITNMGIYGVSNPQKNEEVQQKTQKTNLEVYGTACVLMNEDVKRKSEETNMRLYDSSYGIGEHRSNSIRETVNKKYGVNCFFSTNDMIDFTRSDEIKNKIKDTKSKNNTFNKSTIGDLFGEYLIDMFGKDDIKLEYREDWRYPFACDYYIVSLDMFIELQGFWTHGDCPYDFNNPDHLLWLEKWRKMYEETKSVIYKSAIDVWTNRDVLKRETAKINNLNYLEVFPTSLQFLIDSFEDFLIKNKQGEKYAVYVEKNRLNSFISKLSKSGIISNVLF